MSAKSERVERAPRGQPATNVHIMRASMVCEVDDLSVVFHGYLSGRVARSMLPPSCSLLLLPLTSKLEPSGLKVDEPEK